MLLLRVIGLLAVLVIGSSVFAWLVTRDGRYLKLAHRTGLGALGLGLLFLLLLMAQRLFGGA